MLKLKGLYYYSYNPKSQANTETMYVKLNRLGHPPAGGVVLNTPEEVVRVAEQPNFQETALTKAGNKVRFCRVSHSRSRRGSLALFRLEQKRSAGGRSTSSMFPPRTRDRGYDSGVGQTHSACQQDGALCSTTTPTELPTIPTTKEEFDPPNLKQPRKKEGRQ